MTIQVDKKVFKVKVNDVLQWEGYQSLGILPEFCFYFGMNLSIAIYLLYTYLLKGKGFNSQ